MSNGQIADTLLTLVRHRVRGVPDAFEEGRRIKAALVLRGKSSADVATDMNISSRTLDRTIAGKRQARDWELSRLAELLSIPDWFLARGFEGQPDGQQDSDATTADELARAVERLTGELEQLGRLVPQLEAFLDDQQEPPPARSGGVS